MCQRGMNGSMCQRGMNGSMAGHEEGEEGVKKGKGVSQHHEVGLRVPVKSYMAAIVIWTFCQRPNEVIYVC